MDDWTPIIGLIALSAMFWLPPLLRASERAEKRSVERHLARMGERPGERFHRSPGRSLERRENR